MSKSPHGAPDVCLDEAPPSPSGPRVRVRDLGVMVDMVLEDLTLTDPTGLGASIDFMVNVALGDGCRRLQMTPIGFRTYHPDDYEYVRGLLKDIPAYFASLHRQAP